MVTRALATGLLVLFGLLFGAPAGAADAPFARTIDEMVAQLRSDPVLVQPVLGAGDTEGMHEMLSDLADDVDVPVFVVLAATPSELDGAEYPAEQGAALLRQELGDGLYIMEFDEGIAYARGFGKAAELKLDLGYEAINRAKKSGPNKYNQTTAVFETALLLRAAAHPGDKISDRELNDLMAEPWAFVPTESADRADQLARRWVYAIAAGVSALVAGLALSRIAVRAPLGPRVKKTSSTKPETNVSDRAGGEIDRAQGRFDRLTPMELGAPHGVAADEALQAARLVADTGEELDEVGAWVLALIADRELDRLRKPTLQPYRPCVVDPLHGEATGTLRLAGSSIDAPACHACTRQQGAFLADHTWRGERPYLDTDSVWARTGFGALVDDLARQVLDDRKGRR